MVTTRFSSQAFPKICAYVTVTTASCSSCTDAGRDVTCEQKKVEKFRERRKPPSPPRYLRSKAKSERLQSSSERTNKESVRHQRASCGTTTDDQSASVVFEGRREILKVPRSTTSLSEHSAHGNSCILGRHIVYHSYTSTVKTNVRVR